MGCGNKQLTGQHQRYSMLLQLCLSSCSAMHSSCGRKICGWQSHSQGRDCGEWDFIVGMLLKPAAAQSWYLPLRKQCPAHRSWWGRSSQLLPSSHRHNQEISVNQLICDAASVWARRCGTTCRNAAGAAPSCSCTRQPSPRRCFKCTVRLNHGGGIVMLKRKQEHGSA